MHRSLVFLLGWYLVASLAACSAPPSSAESPDEPIPPPAEPTVVIPTGTPAPSSTLVIDRYTVRSGDTLGKIASRYDVSVDDLLKVNGLTNAHALQIGQVIRIPQIVLRAAPYSYIVPDSEVVYSPAYASFDTVAFANQKNGYLATHREKVDGEWLTGPQVIQLVAERYSVGPRVLLALLEFQTGWVTNSNLTQNQVSYPMGLVDMGRGTLFYQASWAANRLNEGYYGKISGDLAAFRFKDRSRARVVPNANPGSAAVQNVLAQTANWETWLNQIGPSGFLATFRQLFGEATPIEPLVPPGLTQPPLRLPWNDGATWYYTGGPHSAWGDGSAWAAIDLTPGDVSGGGHCLPSRDWALAAAPGRVIKVEHGRVLLSLSNNNFQGAGWALLYMHITPNGRVAAGAQLSAGDRIGHPACEGGDADASHLHFARMYNGQWLDPVTVPFFLSGWQVIPADQQYDGRLMRGSENREAVNGRNDQKNSVVANDVQ